MTSRFSLLDSQHRPMMGSTSTLSDDDVDDGDDLGDDGDGDDDVENDGDNLAGGIGSIGAAQNS